MKGVEYVSIEVREKGEKPKLGIGICELFVYGWFL